MASFTQEVSIKSSDILALRAKYSDANVLKMKETFHNIDDDTIARFLIARNNDISKATELLTANIQWRAANVPVTKASCITEIKKGKLYHYGYDKENHPLLVYTTTKHFNNDRDIDEVVRMATWWIEKLVKELPSDKTKYTLLIDRTGQTNENSDVELVRAVGKILQDNYPERLYRCIVYPSGLVFWSLWNIIKWFLDPVTQAKVQPMMYFSGVQEFINDEYIPKNMGGKSEFEFTDEFAEGLTDPEPVATDVPVSSITDAVASVSIDASTDPVPASETNDNATTSE